MFSTEQGRGALLSTRALSVFGMGVSTHWALRDSMQLRHAKPLTAGNYVTTRLMVGKPARKFRCVETHPAIAFLLLNSRYWGSHHDTQAKRYFPAFVFQLNHQPRGWQMP